MDFTSEAVSTGLGMFIIGSAWAVRHFQANRNGSGKLSKKDHDERCALVIKPILDHQKNSNEQFEKLFNKSDETNKKVDELTGYIKGKLG